MCRKVLDLSAMFPPKDINQLGYGPGFGLFNAAGEYALLSGDKEFTAKLVETAKLATTAKNSRELIGLIAYGAHFSDDKALKDALANLLKQCGTGLDAGIEDLPPEQWPGHAGFKTPALNVNEARDLPLAMAVAWPVPEKPDLSWPKLQPMSREIPAAVPKGWYTPGGEQPKEEKVHTSIDLFERSNAESAEIKTGDVVWKFDKSGIASAKLGDIGPLASSATVFVETPHFREKEGNAESWSFLKNDDKLTGMADANAFLTAMEARAVIVDGCSALRLTFTANEMMRGLRDVRWGLRIPLKLSANAHALQSTAPGAFRLERCRLDQNDERIANWQSSEYKHGEGAPLWPKWRLSGIDIGPGNTYRIWRANRADCAPVFTDQGEGTSNWFDVTDRGANPRWGLTARVLKASPEQRQTIRVNFETGELLIEFHSFAAPPMTGRGMSGTVDLILHDGFRPPLSKPELTAAQYEKFIDDLSPEQYGLNALRFALSITHKVEGRQWMEKIRDLGVEPREILYGMQSGKALEAHCKKIRAAYDEKDLEGTVRRVIEHYKK